LPELPVANGREVVAALLRGGLELRRQRGSHHVLRHPETLAVVSVPVHGSADLRAGTLRAIARDAGLTVDEFRKLLSG